MSIIFIFILKTISIKNKNNNNNNKQCNVHKCIDFLGPVDALGTDKLHTFTEYEINLSTAVILFCSDGATILADQ